MLTKEQRLTLAVLGYLYFRMGRNDAARRIVTLLVSASTEKTDRLSRQAYALLAAVAIEDHKGEVALRHLHAAMDGVLLSSRDAALYLLRARALWMLDRKDEARDAVQQYMVLAGSNTDVSAGEAAS